MIEIFINYLHFWSRYLKCWSKYRNLWGSSYWVSINQSISTNSYYLVCFTINHITTSIVLSTNCFVYHVSQMLRVGIGVFLRWWPPSTMWAPSFRIWDYVLDVEVSFMCHRELWPISVSHPFSLNCSLGFVEDTLPVNYYPIFRYVLENFAISCYFPYIVFYSCIFSLLSPGLFVIAVCGFVSLRKLVKCLE